MKNLHYVGDDSMNRQVYRDESGQLWKDESYGCGEPHIYSVDEFEGESDMPITGEYKIIL